MLMCYFVSCAAFVCRHFPMMQCAFWPLLSQPHGGARFVKRANWPLHIYFGITHWPRTHYSLSLLHFFPMIVLSMICFCQLQNIWPAQVCCFWTWTKLKGCFKSLESFPDPRISTNNTKSIFFFYRHKDRLEEGVGEDEAEVKAGSN